MNVGTRTIAVLLVIAAAMVVGAYQLGNRHQARADDEHAAVPNGMLKSGARLPPGHPAVEEGSDAPFTHFRVGNRNVKSIYINGDIVWIGTSGGVIRYDSTADSYKFYDNRTPGILSNGVFHISRLGDRILMGTYGGGLSVYDPKTDSWRDFNIPDGLADQFVYDTHLDRHGDLWIATWSGINRVKGARLEDENQWETFTVESTNGGLPNPWVYAIAEAKDGTMWFATEYGLARYKDGKWKHWQHPDGLGADYKDVKDDIQFTSDPALASHHHAQQKVEQGLQGISVAYNPNYIISLAVDERGIVWCGTWGAGLARFDGHSWRNYTTKDGLPSDHIFMLHEDNQGRLWIGTSHGLARLNEDDTHFTVSTVANGLFADDVFSMADAKDGSVWVGSFGGVAHIKSL